MDKKIELVQTGLGGWTINDIIPLKDKKGRVWAYGGPVVGTSAQQIERLRQSTEATPAIDVWIEGRCCDEIIVIIPPTIEAMKAEATRQLRRLHRYG